MHSEMYYVGVSENMIEMGKITESTALLYSFEPSLKIGICVE